MLRRVTRGRRGDPWAALVRGTGLDQQRRRADQALVHRGSGLESQQLSPQGVVNTAATLCQRFGHDTGLLWILARYCREATGVHDGEGGAASRADGGIRRAPRVFEPLQGQQDPCGPRGATTVGAFGKAAGTALLHRLDQLGPGKRLGPLAEGKGLWGRRRHPGAEVRDP